MSRNAKIILVVVGSLLVLCVLSCGIVFLLGRQFVLNTASVLRTPQAREAQAKQVGSQIADYTLPPGYSEQMGMDLLVEKLVMIAPGNNRGPLIMMISVNTPTVNRAQLEQQLQQSFGAQYNFGSGSFKDAGTHNVTIKGQPAVLNVRETESSSGLAMRQATGVFQGKGGPVMVMVTGQVNEWNWNLLDAFFASIR
jgi:hypothetical protein